MEEIKQDHLAGMDLQIDHEATQSLNETGKWGKFIAITIFIMCGLMLLMAVLGGKTIMAAIDNIPGGGRYNLGEFGGLIIGVVVAAVIIFAFIYYFLFNFSVKMKAALLSKDTDTFNKALASLKTYFIITTVMAILGLITNLSSLF